MKKVRGLWRTGVFIGIAVLCLSLVSGVSASPTTESMESNSQQQAGGTLVKWLEQEGWNCAELSQKLGIEVYSITRGLIEAGTDEWGEPIYRYGIEIEFGSSIEEAILQALDIDLESTGLRRVDGVTDSLHWARVISFNPWQEKPLEVSRIWKGKEVVVDCYVTQTLVEQYLAGTLEIGDFVLVGFVEGDFDKPLALEKIYKSW